MSIAAALLVAAAAVPQVAATPQRGAQVASATASARIVRSVSVRQGRERAPEGPQVQVSRDSDGSAWIEFL